MTWIKDCNGVVWVFSVENKRIVVAESLLAIRNKKNPLEFVRGVIESRWDGYYSCRTLSVAMAVIRETAGGPAEVITESEALAILEGEEQ